MVSKFKTITFTNNAYKYDLYLDWSIEDTLIFTVRIPNSEYDPIYEAEINLETGKTINSED